MDDHHVLDPFYAKPTASVRPTVPPPAPMRAGGEPTVTASPAAAVEEPPVVARGELYGMRLLALQQLARRLGLDDTGKRPVLIERIKAHDDATRPQVDEVEF